MRKRIFWGLGIAALLAVGGWRLQDWKMEHRHEIDTQLSKAAERRDFAEVKRLVACGANPNGVSEIQLPSGWTTLMNPPIYYTVEAGDLETTRFLLDAGADMKANRIDGLLLTRSLEQEDMFLFLLQRGADPNIRGASCVSLGSDSVLFEIIYNSFRSSKNWPLDRATKMIKAALRYGADINQRGQDGWTPLITAVVYHQTQLIPFLVENGASVRALTNHGWTALDYAAWEEHSQTADLLIAKGAKCEIQHAVVLGRLDDVRRLLTADPLAIGRKYRALVRPKTVRQVTAGSKSRTTEKELLSLQELAEEYGHTEIQTLLHDWQTKLEQQESPTAKGD